MTIYSNVTLLQKAGEQIKEYQCPITTEVTKEPLSLNQKIFYEKNELLKFLSPQIKRILTIERKKSEANTNHLNTMRRFFSFFLCGETNVHNHDSDNDNIEIPSTINHSYLIEGPCKEMIFISYENLTLLLSNKNLHRIEEIKKFALQNFDNNELSTIDQTELQEFLQFHHLKIHEAQRLLHNNRNHAFPRSITKYFDVTKAHTNHDIPMTTITSTVNASHMHLINRR